MNNGKNRVLVVAPYSQRLGVAIFAGSDLIHYAVKTFKLPRTEQSVMVETSAQMRLLINEFRPKSVMVKKLSRRQISSRNQRAILEQVEIEANTARLLTQEFSFEDAKQELSEGVGPTNTAAFRALIHVYPELEKLSHFQNRHQKEYYVPLLTAVAIGRISHMLTSSKCRLIPEQHSSLLGD